MEEEWLVKTIGRGPVPGGAGRGGSLVEKGLLEGEVGDLPGEGAWGRS